MRKGSLALVLLVATLTLSGFHCCPPCPNTPAEVPEEDDVRYVVIVPCQTEDATAKFAEPFKRGMDDFKYVRFVNITNKTVKISFANSHPILTDDPDNPPVFTIEPDQTKTLTINPEAEDAEYEYTVDTDGYSGPLPGPFIEIP